MAQLNSIICTGSARFLNTIYGTCDNSNKLQGYTSDTARTANTIVRRDGNGYIYAAYYNQSSGAETPTSSSYWVYCNSDGWFRKSTLANLRSQLTIPLDHAITSTGSTISVTASATTAKITYNLENPGVRGVSINGNYLRVNTGGTNADLTIPYATSAGSATSATSATTASNLANFENNNSTGKNANDVTYNAHTYYTSNGPTTTLGASTNDGALYAQAYSTSWVGQIAQDYRNGNLFTRGKNNGTWKSWRKVAYSDDTYSGTLTSSQVTTALGYTPYNSTNPSGYTSNTGTVTSVTIKASSPISIDSTAAITTSGTRTISHANSGVTAGTYQSVTVNATGHVTAGSALTKAQVTTALGYTPPTTDTNTTYTFATGSTNGAFSVTPSGGSAQSVSIKGLGSAAYKNESGTWAINVSGSSASCTGNAATATSATSATTATRLDTDAGTYFNPIYFTGGKPEAGRIIFDAGTIGSNITETFALASYSIVYVFRGTNCGCYTVDQWNTVGTIKAASSITVTCSSNTVSIKNTGSSIIDYIIIGRKS